MNIEEPRIVVFTTDCVFTDRPGEDMVVVEGAHLDEPHGIALRPIEVTRRLFEQIDRNLAAEPDCVTCGLLHRHGDHVQFVLVEIPGRGHFYTDGRFHYDTRTLLAVDLDKGAVVLPRAA